jgi:hypothetical protein
MSVYMTESTKSELSTLSECFFPVIYYSVTNFFCQRPHSRISYLVPP